MSREVRITIGDDEVFERMKRRKRELDLSWEEVLHRGLEHRSDGGHGREHGHHGYHGDWPGEWREGRGRGRGHGHAHGGDRPLNPFDDDFERRLRERIEGSVRTAVPDMGFESGAFPFGGDEFEDPLGADIGRLEAAEDAVLSFDFLDGEGARVPLRVNLRTSTTGLDVEVVAVRRGKGARDMNRFGEGDRKEIAEQLVGGATATLWTEDGGESYRVRPILSWTRDGSGRPTVADAEIEEVILGDE